MHLSSFEKMRFFRDAYLSPLSAPLRVLDVGSMSYHAHESYRPLFGEGFAYVGLDLIEGPNVDVVPTKSYVWDELETESFDVVISGQTFEHNPFPWITMAEIARVLKPGGHLCLIAPSRGPVHRYPLDCWRFYPDAASALCSYVGLELLESYVEPATDRVVEGVGWGDFFLIARRTSVDLQRLASIVATQCSVPDPAEKTGPAIAAYEASVRVSAGTVRRQQAKTRAAGLQGQIKRVGDRVRARFR